MQELGVPVISEPNNGTGYGAFLAASSMAADNQSRSDSRIAYAEPVIDQPNLHIATQQMVQRILFDGVNKSALGTTNTSLYKAVGIEVSVTSKIIWDEQSAKPDQFAASDQDTSRNVTCAKELILAAGAVFSPTLLQISGIGPLDELTALGIPVKVALPGVGSNAQDHGMLHPIYSCESSIGRPWVGFLYSRMESSH